MAILSDSSIVKLSTPPSHSLCDVSHQYETLYYWEGIDEVPLRAARLSEAEQTAYLEHHPPMIAPFSTQQVKTSLEGQRIVSWGTSSFGYDVRLADTFKIFTNVRNGTIDPLNPDPSCFVDHQGEYCIIPPNSYILGHTVESFHIPNDIMVICVGKSTYARLAAVVNVTPIEPGFSGQVVIEIANCSTLPLKVYANQGIAQFLFFKGDQPCRTSYADRGGKYQNQQGVTLARL